MRKLRLGFVGCGNMGSALLQGALTSQQISERFSLAVYVRNKAAFSLPAGVEYIDSAGSLARWADYILLAVKPFQVHGVLQDIAAELAPEKAVISIAAGVSIAALKEAAHGRCPVVRVMPNTPVGVGKGISGICLDDATIAAEQAEAVQAFFDGMGSTTILAEDKFNAFSAVAGCGPAFVYYMVDAVIEAAVTLGFKRAEAKEMALALFEGSISLAKCSDESPNALRERVCSPGGMTIAGTNYLDSQAVRGHIVKCVAAAYERGCQLS